MSNQVICIKKRKSYDSQGVTPDYKVVDVTQHNRTEWVAHELQPLWAGPVQQSDGAMCYRFENLWQYTKVYKQFTDIHGNPTKEYFEWRNQAFNNQNKGVRFPFGKVRKPEYALWMIDGQWHKLGYIEARKLIYIPEYAKLVVNTKSYQIMKNYYEDGGKIALLDFDAYNNEMMNMSMVDVFNTYKKAGHGFVLKMLLEGDIEVKNGAVIDNIGVLKI